MDKLSKTILIILSVIVLGVVIIYLFYWNKYNSLSPEEKFYRNNNQHLIEKDTYYWPKIRLKIKLSSGYKAIVQPLVGGVNDLERPTEISIYRNSTTGMISGSDTMNLNIRDYQGTLDNFIDYAQSSKNSGSYFTDRNREPLGLTKIDGNDAKWFKAKSKYPTSKLDVYEVYFVNKYRGFILEANYKDWSKIEIEQILSGISFQ